MEGKESNVPVAAESDVNDDLLSTKVGGDVAAGGDVRCGRRTPRG